MAKTPFTDSMAAGNYPDTGGAKSGELTITHNTADPMRGNEVDTPPIQDNGTQGKHSNVAGAPSGNSFPPIPNYGQGATTGNDQSIAQYGLKEGDVGHAGGVQDYGLKGA